MRRARAENPAYHAKIVTAHMLEPQRLVGCTHTRRNVTQVDFLVHSRKLTYVDKAL